jgi:hypothetical protein
LRHRTVRVALFLSWLVLSGSAFVGTLPLNAQLAHATANLPGGDRELFRRGGMLLLDLLNARGDTLAVAARTSGLLLLASLVICTWSRALVWLSLAQPTLAPSRAAGLSMYRLPRLALGWVCTRVLQLVCLLLGPLIAAPLLHSFQHLASEKSLDIALAGAALCGAVAGALLQFAWTALGSQLVRGLPLGSSLRATVAHLRRPRGAPLGGWLTLHGTGVLLPTLSLLFAAQALARVAPPWTALLQQLSVAGGIVLQAAAAALVIRWTRSEQAGPARENASKSAA